MHFSWCMVIAPRDLLIKAKDGVLTGTKNSIKWDRSWPRRGVMNACNAFMWTCIVHTIKKKAATTGRVRHSLTVPRLHSHFREHLAGRQPARSYTRPRRQPRAAPARKTMKVTSSVAELTHLSECPRVVEGCYGRLGCVRWSPIIQHRPQDFQFRHSEVPITYALPLPRAWEDLTAAWADFSTQLNSQQNQLWVVDWLQLRKYPLEVLLKAKKS